MNSLRSPAPSGNLFNFGPRNSAKNAGVFTNAANSVANAFNTAKNTVTNTVSNTVSKGPSVAVIVLMVFLFAVVVCFAVFWNQIQEGVKKLFGGVPPPPPPPEDSSPDVNKKPSAPQDTPNMTSQQKLVEKIIPGKNEVYNISKNSYSYYDAEPLCKALGAELATYEQVKQAYAQGADWCNYGWVKGQMAVFPTQQGTWEQLQNGPEEQRNACGRPGINGGYFDNPEMKFGVNCFGPKLEQKDHDATAIAAGDGAPLSVGGLEFERKIAKYRGELNSIGVLPWNRERWSS